MAIFHLDVKTISRSQGRSVVASAAYRAGEKLIDNRQGLAFDYSKKGGVVYSEIMAPNHAPAWARDRVALWNAVESMEKRKDSQVAREVMVALPKELNQEQHIDLLQAFCWGQFVSKGMIADMNIHADNPENPHAHILLTMREITPEGFGLKVREWNSRQLVFEQRRAWQELTNKHLAIAGYDVSIDCRSLKDRGLNLEPNLHLGPAAHHAGQRGEGGDLQRHVDHLDIMRANGERIIENPLIGLEKLTQQESVFDEYAIAKFANQNSADLEQYQKIISAIKSSEHIVILGENDKGKTCYATRSMVELEHHMLNEAYELDAKNGHKVNLEAANAALVGKSLNESQRSAFSHIISPGDLKIVTGLAGTGKSYLMGVAREAFRQSGFNVTGVCLSGIAAKGLQDGSGIPSTTVESKLYQWGRGEGLLTKKDVLVIDEAGMLGTKKMSQLLHMANDTGAKVVIVHDKEQLGAIQAGAPSRALAERFGEVKLTDVVRQHSAEMRRATYEFGTGETVRALQRYERLGSVHTTAADEKVARMQLIEAWASDRLEGKSQLILSYTNDSVKALNEQARQVRIAAGEIKPGEKYRVSKGERAFSEGDRVYFLKNDRNLGVRNGSLGIVKAIKGGNFSVMLDGEKNHAVNVDLREYDHLDHGYAATIHKGQGVTVDKAYVLVSKYFDRHLTYVACTRHRENLQLFAHQSEFKNKQDFYRTISRERSKTMAVDFAMARWIDPKNTNELRVNPKESAQKQLALNRLALKIAQATMAGKHISILKGFEKARGYVQGVFEIAGKKLFAKIIDDKIMMSVFKRERPHQLDAIEKTGFGRNNGGAAPAASQSVDIQMTSSEKTQNELEITR